MTNISTPRHVRRIADLSVAEFSDAKGISQKTCRNWIAAGIIRAERIGPRLIRIPASELERIGRPIAAA